MKIHALTVVAALASGFGIFGETPLNFRGDTLEAVVILAGKQSISAR